MVCCSSDTLHLSDELEREASAFQGLPNALREKLQENFALNSHLQMYFPSQFLILLLRDMSKTHKYLPMNIVYSALGKWCYLHLCGE